MSEKKNWTKNTEKLNERELREIGKRARKKKKRAQSRTHKNIKMMYCDCVKETEDRLRWKQPELEWNGEMIAQVQYIYETRGAFTERESEGKKENEMKLFLNAPFNTTHNFI